MIATVVALMGLGWVSGEALSAEVAASDLETAKVIATWEVSVYGAKPEITADVAARRGSQNPVKVMATELSDTALGKEIMLKPNAWYQFSGWVKTEGLLPQTATVYGTLQVQNPGGRGILASGPSHGGNTPWSWVPVIFRAPSDGRVRVCLFFAGFGKATGVAWFDDLKLAEIDPSAALIRVTREKAAVSAIEPSQYGQFIEYLCNLVPSMWAEKLYDGSFEGLSPYQFEFIRETDFQEKPWYPSGEVSRARYELDKTNKVNGDVSKKIVIEPGVPCFAGVSQDGIFVEGGGACEFKCWLKAENLQGPVRVSVHRGRQIYAVCEFVPGREWKRFTAPLRPNDQDDNATLSIEARGPGTLWLDNASLMPSDTVGGWRKDVVEAVRALKPGVIRFGGSAVDVPSMGDFEWKDTIGDPDRRRPFRAWGGLQPTGPGLEEIVQFIRAVGAEPLICVRTVGRTPKDAADQVEYFNGANSTPMGAWRTRNGHPQAYAIKYWQVGNERFGADYEEQLPAFCQAMKAAAPGVQLLSAAPTPSVLKGAGQRLDYVCPHHYSQDLVWMDNDLGAVERMIAEYAPGRAIKVAVTEWNTTAGDAGPRRAMLWTLGNALACSRYHNLLHRHCDLVKIANRSNLANSFCSGIIQTDNHRLFKTPTYYAQQLYASLAGNQPLKIESEIPTNLGPDISATLSSDGREVSLFAVNDSVEAVTRPLDFSSLAPEIHRVRIWTLGDRDRAGDPDVVNSFLTPERIVPTLKTIRALAGRFEYRFPPLSLTVIKIDVKR